MATSDMNQDLNQIALWARNWRMSFNPDAQKQAVELVFSTKKLKSNHPLLFFNGSPLEVVDEHKHLGVILDSKLSFSAHIQAAINKSRKAIGMLKFLSKYLPRNTLNAMCKLYVRPHLDYGDLIYHVPQQESVSESYMMGKFESVQYSAALAVTRVWRGTAREKLYSELGWVSLGSRKWSRRLILFYKILKQLDYTRNPISLFVPSSYVVRNPPIVKHIASRTESFKSSFHSDALSE